MTDITKLYIARVIIEADTPLHIGSGEKTVKTDSVVLRDINGLPYIPGTTLAGLIRHSLPKEIVEKIMGTQDCGSSLIISEAKMLGYDGKVIDNFLDKDKLAKAEKEFLDVYRQMPIRQHARIGHKGVTEDGGKFDEEVALKGTRFCFELELRRCDDEAIIKRILDVLHSPIFRIGANSRSGFGKIKIVECKYKAIDLTDANQREWYLTKSSSLTEDWNGTDYKPEKPKCEEWSHYELHLQPEDFLMFSSGFGNDTTDATFVTEHYVKWVNGKATVVEGEKAILIPASSVKGAISHRVAYHYNKITGNFADKIEPDEANRYIGKENAAVKALFGSEGEKEGNKTKDKQRGNVLFSDVIQERKDSSSPKLINHVKIDRFTGGAIDGALFDEEVLYAPKEEFTLTMYVHNSAIADGNENIRKAFEATLQDICDGLLPLGGSVNRGYGSFKGSIIKMED